MPRKPPAIEPPDSADIEPTDAGSANTESHTEPLDSTDPTTSGASDTTSSTAGDPNEPETTPLEGSEPTASASAGQTPRPPSSTGNRFFSWIRGIDIRREPGWIGGVCAGIAARLGIDPIIVRGIAVVVAVLGGPAILLYAVTWLLLPDSNDKIHLEEVIRGRLEAPIAAIGALIVLSILPVTQGFWLAGAGFWGEPHWDSSIGRAIWTVALLGALVWFIVWLARRGSSSSTAPGPAPATRPRDAASFVASPQHTTAPTTAFATAPPTNAAEPEMAAWREQQAQVRAEQDAFRNQQASDRAAANRAAADEAKRKRDAQREVDRAEDARTRSHPLFSLIVIGLSIVAGGVATLAVSPTDITVTSAVVGLSVMLAVLAIGIIINGVRGKRSGGAAGLAAIVLPALLIAGAIPATAEAQFATWGRTSVLIPTTSQDFAIGGGRIELDLTDIDFDEPDAGYFGEEVELRLGAGQAIVIVPDDANVQFSGSVGAGQIDAGPNAELTRIGPMQNASATFSNSELGADAPQLIVNVQLGAGQITVIEEGATR